MHPSSRLPAAGLGLLLLAYVIPPAGAEDNDAWVAKIRRDHPRLFFSADTWPAVKQRALTVLKGQLAKVKEHADGPPSKEEWSKIERPAPRPGSTLEVRDYGDQLMSSAFVYRVNPDPKRLKKIKEMLQASLDYYNACFAVNKAVNWYARSRVGWLAAFDWVWSDLTPQERRRMGQGMLKHIHEEIYKPNIQNRCLGDYQSGYYGGNGLAFFAGILFLNEGIDDAKALAFLKKSYGEYQKVLAHRSQMAGDDGGAASESLNYSFNEYPWAEWNFFYTWQAATGDDVSGTWPYVALLPNYVMWNWLPGGLEFGCGDTLHTTNKLSPWWMYTHMSHIMHFFGKSHPDRAALAAYVRKRFPVFYHSMLWSVYPFPMTNLEKAPPSQDPRSLPLARHFENMGQVFMRSGDGGVFAPDWRKNVDGDAYAMFACGGISDRHRHYDALHFTIYKMGFLALDSGTREGNTDNLQNYFGQTVAHNCILIKMAGEPPSPYWNGTVFGQAGGQNKSVGSKVIAFETCKDFSYVAGDATPVYDPKKCRQMVRQFVFVPPDYFIVFDRATSTKPEYKKTWLLHHANEPIMVDAKTWRSDQDRGRIFCRTLLPEDAVLEKVGGPGKEFLVDGVNYPITKGPNPNYTEVPELMGRWRMEVKPGAARQEDIFLHLMQVGDRKLKSMSEAKVTTSSPRTEVTFPAGGKTVALSFSATGKAGGHVRITKGGQVLVDRDLTKDVMPQTSVATVSGDR